MPKNQKRNYRQVAKIGPFSRDAIAWALSLADPSFSSASESYRESLIDKSIEMIATRKPKLKRDHAVLGALKAKPSWSDTDYESGYRMEDADGNVLFDETNAGEPESVPHDSGTKAANPETNPADSETINRRDVTRILKLAKQGAALASRPVIPDAAIRVSECGAMFTQIAEIAEAIDARTGRKDPSLRKRGKKSAAKKGRGK